MYLLIACCLALVSWRVHASASAWFAHRRSRRIQPPGRVDQIMPLRSYLVNHFEEVECSGLCKRCRVITPHQRRLLERVTKTLRARCNEEGCDLDAHCNSDRIHIAAPPARLRVLTDADLLGPSEAAGWDVSEEVWPEADVSLTTISLRGEASVEKEKEDARTS
ncbi:MAG: hypothetical protein AAGJ19_22040 [Myxococcota bacterium]